MKRCMATISLAGDLDSRVRAIAAAGFDGIELTEDDVMNGELSPEGVGQFVRDLGLEIYLYQPIRDIEGVSPEQFERNLRRVERTLRVMDRIGVTTMQICSNVTTAVSADPQLAADQLRQIADRAAKRDFRVAYEPIGWGKYVNHWQQGWEIVQLADHPSLGICLDSYHVASGGDDPSGMAAIPPDKIFIVQISDNPHLNGDHLAISRAHRLFPGEGDFDSAGYLASILATGYDGVVSLEIFDEAGRHGCASEAAPRGLQALNVTIDQARSRLSGPVSATALSLSGISRIRIGATENTDVLLDLLGSSVCIDPTGTGITGIEWSDAGGAAKFTASSLRSKVSHAVVTKPGGTSRIDHVTLAIPSNSFDAEVLFIRSVLGLEVERGPYVVGALAPMRAGIARSQSGRPLLRLDHALDAFDRIVISTDDVEAAATRARSLGVLVEPPAGYYDIVASRFEFDGAQLERLKTHGLLYDEDASGTYLHCVAGPFDRLLVEFAERRGYAGTAEVSGPVMSRKLSLLAENGSSTRTLL
jgi:4-hydroxyphenylpyruvate dioxygenase